MALIGAFYRPNGHGAWCWILKHDRSEVLFVRNTPLQEACLVSKLGTPDVRPNPTWTILFDLLRVELGLKRDAGIVELI